MHRRTVLGSALAGSLASAVSTPFAAAQEGAGDLAAHPVVGLWSNEGSPETPSSPRALVAFHGDGTLTSLNAFGGTGLGAWQAGEGRSVRMVLAFYNIAQVPGEFADGTVTVAGSMTVDEAGATLAEESTVDIRGADGAVVANFPNTATFARMTAESVVLPVVAPGTGPAIGTPAA